MLRLQIPVSDVYLKGLCSSKLHFLATSKGRHYNSLSFISFLSFFWGGEGGGIISSTHK